MLTVTRCAGCISANTRPHQLCWGDWECGYHTSCTTDSWPWLFPATQLGGLWCCTFCPHCCLSVGALCPVIWATCHTPPLPPACVLGPLLPDQGPLRVGPQHADQLLVAIFNSIIRNMYMKTPIWSTQHHPKGTTQKGTTWG